MGKAEKTEQDPNFEQLVTFCDNTKQNTESILKNMEFILNSNPGSFSLILNYNQLCFLYLPILIFLGMRVENLFFLDKKKSGLSSSEYLGIAMTEAGNDFGPDTAYGKVLFLNKKCVFNIWLTLGSALIKVGNIQQTLGLNQREFIKSANDCFVNPMNKYLETDMKTVVKERSLLEKRRQIYI